MNRWIEWRGVFGPRTPIAPTAGGAADRGTAFTRERLRELDQPTWLRRNLQIDGLVGPDDGPPPRRARLTTA
jgi:hypothetical protein